MSEIKPAVRESIDRFGILNAYGTFWTDDTFRTPEAAWKHLREYWDQPGFEANRDISQFQVVPVLQTVTEVLAGDQRLPQPQPTVLAKERG